MTPGRILIATTPSDETTLRSSIWELHGQKLQEVGAVEGVRATSLQALEHNGQGLLAVCGGIFDARVGDLTYGCHVVQRGQDSLVPVWDSTRLPEVLNTGDFLTFWRDGWLLVAPHMDKTRLEGVKVVWGRFADSKPAFTAAINFMKGASATGTAPPPVEDGVADVRMVDDERVALVAKGAVFVLGPNQGYPAILKMAPPLAAESLAGIDHSKRIWVNTVLGQGIVMYPTDNLSPGAEVKAPAVKLTRKDLGFLPFRVIGGDRNEAVVEGGSGIDLRIAIVQADPGAGTARTLRSISVGRCSPLPMPRGANSLTCSSFVAKSPLTISHISLASQ